MGFAAPNAENRLRMAAHKSSPKAKQRPESAVAETPANLFQAFNTKWKEGKQMGMFVCEREKEEEGRGFPSKITCNIGVIVLELEFCSWSRADGFAIYRDTNSHREDFKVFNNDGTLVADIRED